MLSFIAAHAADYRGYVVGTRCTVGGGNIQHVQFILVTQKKNLMR